MKRFTLFSLVLLCCCPLWIQAQLSKGTWYVKGYQGSPLPVAQNLAGASYFNHLVNETDLFTVNIAPELGYFFSKRLLVGSRLGASVMSKNEVVDGNRLLFSPFLRYYINPDAANNHFFINGQLNTVIAKDNNAISGDIGVGMTHFIAPGIGLDAYLALVEPHFEIRRNTQIGLFTSLNVYLNPEMKANRKMALPEFQRGSLLIGGTSASGQVGITQPRAGAQNVNQLSISPNVLYFISNRFALGGALNIGFTGNSSFTSTNLGISPRVRYYLNSAQHNLFFLAGAYHYDSNKFKFGERDLETNSSRATFAAGLNSFLTSNLALELAPNFNYNFTTDDARIGLDLGIQFFLHPKK